jgi:hypothetical protein
MKKHPSRKEIIGASLDATRMTGPLRDHLAGCDACAARYAEATRLLVPSGPELLAPPDGSLARIIASGRVRHVTEETRPYHSWKDTLLRPVPASALAAVLAAVIIIPLLFLIRGRQGDDMVPAFDMTITRVEGAVSRTAALAPADTVTTPVGETAYIGLNGRLEIALDGGSFLTLEQAFRDRSGGKRKFFFILAHGSLRARLATKSGFETILITPHGRLTALGTEFRLDVTGGSTVVLLREGSLAVESLSGQKSVITGGMKCVINGGITTAPMSARDFAAFTVLSGTRSTPGSPAAKKEIPLSHPVNGDPSAVGSPAGGAHGGESVREKTSRPAVRKEIKNELRGIKETRRSLRRGQK